MPKEYIVICREPENKSPEDEERLLRAVMSFDRKLREREAKSHEDSDKYIKGELKP